MNKYSSTGITEELITNLMNTVAHEYHIRITYEKYWSQINVKGIPNTDEEFVTRQKLESQKELLKVVTEQRRNVMKELQKLSENGNQDLWCMVKHSALGAITAFEAWQVDLNNNGLEQLYHDAVKVFNLTISEFLGFYPVACSACLSDAFKEQEQLNNAIQPTTTEDVDSIVKNASEVFGIDLSKDLANGTMVQQGNKGN